MTTTAPDVFTGGQEALTTEEATNATWQYAPGTVPGLLQTPGYATAVANSLPHLDRGRQDRFRLRIEPVLHGRPHVGRREQLGDHPGVTVRDVREQPSDTGGGGDGEAGRQQGPSVEPGGGIAVGRSPRDRGVGVPAAGHTGYPAADTLLGLAGPAQDAAEISSWASRRSFHHTSLTSGAAVMAGSALGGAPATRSNT
ncbi:Scr1 family TA system antitoxin-like transcriptional regulator [Nocardiopsis sp. CT-R113]|uniref:Scr1 family TA system antitoxin-like transcriptional regulator n=1 Tax=Nocardiopsis codii TaxID=3065942 RepID=A0ABU7K6V0_9ACTN|nr:Scr1 family TA system antitoxin-like transcriptional regulator [Nocardiopsis sp. CT-R113]MEE2037968.1 Scr1 family TA system antitoxin-like transcriptional regulator [Nocardiopsis sp. CT-R113]